MRSVDPARSRQSTRAARKDVVVRRDTVAGRSGEGVFGLMRPRIGPFYLRRLLLQAAHQFGANPRGAVWGTRPQVYMASYVDQGIIVAAGDSDLLLAALCRTWMGAYGRS